MQTIQNKTGQSQDPTFAPGDEIPHPQSGGTIVKFLPPIELADVPTPAPTPFPIHCLPPVIRAIVEDAAKTNLVPHDLPSSIALAVAAAALGQGLQTDSPPHITTGNLFVFCSANSGVGKSAVYKNITKPLFDEEDRRLEKFQNETLPDLLADKGILENEKQRLKNKENSTARLKEISRELVCLEKSLTSPRLIAEDSTSEQLAVILEASRETLAIISPESGDVVANLFGRYNSNGKSERTNEHLWLKGYSRDSHRVDRIGRPSIVLKSPCMAALLVMTPPELRGLFENERFRTGGLLPRCLICNSSARPQPDDGTSRRHNPEIALAWSAAITTLIKSYHDREHPAIISMSPGAAAVFRQAWNNEFVAKFDQRQETAAFDSRYVENGKRLALVLHALEHLDNAHACVLAESTARSALEIMAFLSAHQTAMLASVTEQSDRLDLAKIQAEITANGTEFTAIGSERSNGKCMTMRVLKRSGWKEERIRTLAGRFTGVLSIEQSKPGQQGGRHSTLVVSLNKVQPPTPFISNGGGSNDNTSKTDKTPPSNDVLAVSAVLA